MLSSISAQKVVLCLNPSFLDAYHFFYLFNFINMKKIALKNYVQNSKLQKFHQQALPEQKNKKLKGGNDIVITDIIII